MIEKPISEYEVIKQLICDAHMSNFLLQRFIMERGLMGEFTEWSNEQLVKVKLENPGVES